MRRTGHGRRCFALGVGLSLAGLAWSAPAALADASLNYDVDAALTYLDAARLPLSVGTVAPGRPLAAAGANGNAAADPGGASAPRTLGLRRLALGLSWAASPVASLHLVLRPDAVNRQSEPNAPSPVRELDTRSGDPGLQPLPTVRLLDEYQLVLHSGRELSVGIGVWAGLEPTELAYPELLGFGLKVLFPAKFSGLLLDWQPPNASPDTAEAAGAGRKAAPGRVGLMVFQGNEDRAETLAPKHDTFDTAPSAQDPYYGLAFRGHAGLGAGLSLGLLAAYLDQSQAQGRFDQVFGQVSLSEDLPLFGRSAKLNLEGRYLRSRGHGGVAPQTLVSGSATASLAVASQLWALLGCDYGKSDRWTSDLVRTTTKALQGYQLETGVYGRVGSEVSLQLMLSREYRQLRDQNGKGGGFQDAEGNRSLLNRVGLELTYQLNKNA